MLDHISDAPIVYLLEIQLLVILEIVGLNAAIKGGRIYNVGGGHISKHSAYCLLMG